MGYVGKKVLVIGLGRSGLSAAQWLTAQGASVTVSEKQERESLDERIVRETQRLGITLETGGHRRETFLNTDIIIASPGVPLGIPPLAAAKKAGIPVMGEMELASRLMDIPLLAVTGTNGKSTMTAFLAALMEKAGRKVFMGGNIGTPLMAYHLEKAGADVAVVEVSSFQLDTMETFSPDLAVLMNISPDHLDRYSDYEAYVASKLRIFENQGPGQTAILNDGDQRLREVALEGGMRVLRYGLEERTGRHAFLQGRSIRVSLPGEGSREFDAGPFRLHGLHNLENLVGGVLAGLAMKVDSMAIQETIGSFEGLPHRLQHAGRVQGVDFYDDSKATNVDAASRSIASFDCPVILIAGGRDKGGDYMPMVEAARGRVKKALLLGESRELLEQAFQGVVPFEGARDMEDAVIKALTASQAGDAVLLAPACSSFDMFEDYVHRGMVFQEAVKGLDRG